MEELTKDIIFEDVRDVFGLLGSHWDITAGCISSYGRGREVTRILSGTRSQSGDDGGEDKMRAWEVANWHGMIYSGDFEIYMVYETLRP